MALTLFEIINPKFIHVNIFSLFVHEIITSTWNFIHLSS